MKPDSDFIALSAASFGILAIYTVGHVFAIPGMIFGTLLAYGIRRRFPKSGL